MTHPRPDSADQPPYDILSEASLAETLPHVLKHGDTFAIFDRRGDIQRGGNGEQGLYHGGTRYLSAHTLHLQGRIPVLLNSAVHRDSTLLTVDLTNPNFVDEKGRRVVHGMLHLFRAKLLWHASAYEHLRIRNYGTEPVDISLSFVTAADYADIFEVRGTRRDQRGELLDLEPRPQTIRLGYHGLDDRTRRTDIHFATRPDEITSTAATYRLHLEPQERRDLYVTVRCDEQDGNATDPERTTTDGTAHPTYGEAKQQLKEVVRTLNGSSCHISTSNEEFNTWIDRSLNDLNLLLTETASGYYPYAGIPWYNTFFGRDGLLSALMSLWINPDIARGVLGYLARTQASSTEPERVSQPGKILHEARAGEMAATGEIPFQRYYGTVDATPLFVLLAGAYHEHTGDHAFAEKIWPHVARALEWIDTYGDADGDGFVEYEAHRNGLTQQGWKDSEDSVFHSDGRLAEGPIALCEVQAYVYAAKKRVAPMAEQMGRSELAARLREDAHRLRERFESAFWCDDLSMYALALDGERRPCRVRSSNAGHALFAGIASEQHARQTARALFEDDIFCGWGIRTLSDREQRYNPMSYHNGSVWPHDNALIGWGLGRYGHRKEVHRLLQAFFDATRYDQLMRLPELFCGFVRRTDEGPTPYPVACAPQAWASVVPFFLLQASLGLSIDAAEQCVLFRQPSLPDFIDELVLRNLRVREGTVDLRLERHAESVGVEVLRRDPGIEVVTIT